MAVHLRLSVSHEGMWVKIQQSKPTAAILRVKQACVGCYFTPPFNIRPATICDVMLLLMAITLTTIEPPCAHCAILPHALNRAVKHYVLSVLFRFHTASTVCVYSLCTIQVYDWRPIWPN
eukprot:scaffold76735_cov78-Phaeocystis_antarctica.AAC.2